MFSLWKYIFRNFFFSREIIEEGNNGKLLNLPDVQNLVLTKRLEYDIKIQPKSKKIYAENVKNPNLNKIYLSLNQLSKELKGDRCTIRSHLKGEIGKLYRNEWKFKYIND